METIIKYDSVFNELDIIAFGSFGIVCKAIDKNSNKIFAVKKVPINKHLKEKTLREIEILSELKSEHIVKLESFWIQNNYYYRNNELKGKLGSSHELFKQNNNLLLHIQMELCYKTLKEIIQILNKELNQKQSELLFPLGYYISSEIFIEILESVDYLHKQHLIHRNLKPNNILITDGRVGRFVKIADFGLAKIHKINEDKDIEIIRYAAPEVMDGISYDTKVDIFSLGVIVQEIFNVDINEPIEKFSDLEMNYSNLFDLIAKMLSTHSYDRPNCEEILRVKKLWALSLTQLLKSTDLTTNVKMMSIEESFSMFFIQTKYHFQNKYDQMTCQESLGIYNFEKDQALKNAKLIYVQEMDKHFVKQEFIFAKVLQDMHILSKCLSHNKFETDFFPNSINERIEEEFNNTIEKIYEQYKRQNLTYIPIKPAIGIDLGTNYSCVGVMIRGKVHIILSLYALNTSPSYIAFTKNGKVFNGKSADEYVKLSNKIYDLKTKIKAKYNDYFNQEDMESLRIVVLNENNTHKVELRNNDYINLYPEELSTKILPQLKIDAENFLGFKVNNAVITVPAYFNDAQRQATKVAGLSAGLNVLQTMNKPTAAAIAYYYQIKDNFRKNVVIYDLGERTFEVTVVIIENGIIEVKAVGGDTHLGSVYFAQRVLDFLMETLKDKFNKAYNQTTTLDRLRRHCENKMWGLTEINSTIISINGLLPGYDFKYELTRKLIEDLCIDLFEKTIKIMDQTLKSTKIEANDIHEVVLIGGSTKIPQIQSLLRKYFKDKPLNQYIKPDETVAYGATIQAALFNGEKFSNSNIGLIHDVLPFSLGIEASDKSMAIIIPRNTKIPCERTQKLQITKDKQTFILIQIFEGENKIAKQNILLGEFIIDGLLKKCPGKIYVEVTIKLDTEGIMHVKGVSSNRSANLTITEHRGRIPADELKMLSAKSYKEKQF